MNPEKEYNNRVEELKKQLKSKYDKRNILTIAKVIFFVISCIGIYKWITSADEIFSLMVFPSTFLYIFLNKI